jgi:DNA-binding transcriptional LysR family regulator
MLDVRRLRILHAVSRHGSITAAAAALGYSGPAVSQQLAALEREVGLPLTERQGRSIALTAAANVLVAHTEVLFTQLAAAESAIAQFTGHVSGLVTVAAFPSAAANLVPPAWAAITATSRHVQVRLEEMEPEESIPALLNHDVDVAVTHSYDLLPRPLDAQYDVRPLIEEPVLLAVPVGPDTNLADTDPADSVDLSTMADRPFLMPRANTSCAEMIHRACAHAGFVPRVAARATDFDVQLNLVAAGVGVALVPHLATRRLPPGVRLVRLATPLTRSIFTVSVQGGYRKPAVRVVIDALEATAAADAAQCNIRLTESATHAST